MLFFGEWRLDPSTQQSPIPVPFSLIMQGLEENILTLSPPNLESLPKIAGSSKFDIIGIEVQEKKLLNRKNLSKAFTDSIWSTTQKWKNWLVSGVEDLTLYLRTLKTRKGWKGIYERSRKIPSTICYQGMKVVLSNTLPNINFPTAVTKFTPILKFKNLLCYFGRQELLQLLPHPIQTRCFELKHHNNQI